VSEYLQYLQKQYRPPFRSNRIVQRGKSRYLQLSYNAQSWQTPLESPLHPRTQQSRPRRARETAPPHPASKCWKAAGTAAAADGPKKVRQAPKIASVSRALLG
jgi:hypothetical protein